MKRKSSTLVNVLLMGFLSLLSIGTVCMLRTRMQTMLSESNRDGEQKSIEEIMAGAVEQRDDLDISEDTGLLYVNNQIILYAENNTPIADIKEIAGKYDAVLDTSIAEYDIYRLKLQESRTEEELEDIIRHIKKEECIENVRLNYGCIMEVQDIIPSDPWNDDEWDCDDPEGLNWGMEAIDAPGAWECLDEMHDTAVGLIDSRPFEEHEDLTFEGYEIIRVDEKGEWDASGIEHYDDHGTHVAGIISADYDNNAGVSGIMGNKGKLYYYSIADQSDADEDMQINFSFDQIACIVRLLDHDVRVINVSIGYRKPIGYAATRGNEEARALVKEASEGLEEALLKIIRKRQQDGKPDFVICNSAGNDSNRLYYRDNEAEFGYRTEPTIWESLWPYFCSNVESGEVDAKYNYWLSYIETEEIRDRVLCVGAVQRNRAGLFHGSSYSYTSFSSTGSRIDIAAPGKDIYSCIYDEGNGGYGKMTGTSMAAPHAAGVAGLVFAVNPELSGPQVKSILASSADEWFSYTGGSCGMVNAKKAVEKALETDPEDPVVNEEDAGDGLGGLDLCFVIDTTGSMCDDIEDARKNMSSILAQLGEKTEDFRVAMIDYRDYPDRTGYEEDYPAKLQMGFTANGETIQDAIDHLELGDGGDNPETVYSALIMASGLDWREGAEKAVILLGDAEPLDPEPYTELTYDETLARLFGAGISFDAEKSDGRIMDYPEKCRVNVYSIGANPSSEAETFMDSIAQDTGGIYQRVNEAEEVSAAVISSIQEIKLSDRQKTVISFSQDKAGDRIAVYSEHGDFACSLQPDEDGKTEVMLSPGEYIWVNEENKAEGRFTVREGKKRAVSVNETNDVLTRLLVIAEQNEGFLVFLSILIIVLSMLLPVLINRVTAEDEESENDDVNKAGE